MSTRDFQWNISGDMFFELHLKFEELYNDSLSKIDEIAKRILTLGFTPLHSYEYYSKVYTAEVAKNIYHGNRAIEAVFRRYEAILPLQRKRLALWDNSND